MDKWIHRCAGPLLAGENGLKNGCNEGEAVLSSGHKLPAKRNTLHSAEVEKLCLKWSTLTSHFSAHFCTEGAKFLTGISELPKNPRKNLELKIEGDVRQKNTKNLFGVFAQVKIGLKILSQKEIFFIKATF